jgi:hypothetical protein
MFNNLSISITSPKSNITNTQTSNYNHDKWDLLFKKISEKTILNTY